MDNPAILLKLQLFEKIETPLNKFLIINFQTDNPMVMFMAEALDNVLRNFYNRFVREDVMEKANTT